MLKTLPAVAPLGCVVMAKTVAAAGFTVKALDVALVRLVAPVAVKSRLKFDCATSSRKLVNVTVPLPADVPISKATVPCNGPVPPLWMDAVTVSLAANPTVEALP